MGADSKRLPLASGACCTDGGGNHRDDVADEVEDLLVNLRRALTRSNEKILLDFSKHICDAMGRRGPCQAVEAGLRSPPSSGIRSPGKTFELLTTEPLPGQTHMQELQHCRPSDVCSQAWPPPPPQRPSTADGPVFSVRNSLGSSMGKYSMGARPSSDSEQGLSIRHRVSDETIKEQVREKFSQGPYHVTDLYNDSKYARIAAHPLFDYFTLCVIAANALWIAYDTDQNKEDVLIEAEWRFQLAEHLFCAFFSAEWLIRFQSFKNKWEGFQDGWFAFDSCLVITMVCETWLLSAILALVGTDRFSFESGLMGLFRLLRLCRLARLTRLIRAVPELVILCKGMSGALRSVLFTLCLLFIMIFIFAVTLTQLTDNTDLGTKYFENVSKSMLSLMIEGTLPDQAELIRDGIKQDWLLGALILIFVLLASLTILNMLVGVLCEVVAQTSKEEKEAMDINFLKSKMQAMLELDQNGDNLISKDEFMALMQQDEAAQVIHDVGVDIEGLLDFADFIFRNGEELTFPQFLDLILDFRGEAQAKVKDIIDLKRVLGIEVRKAIHVALEERFPMPEEWAPSANPASPDVNAHGPDNRSPGSKLATMDGRPLSLSAKDMQVVSTTNAVHAMSGMNFLCSVHQAWNPPPQPASPRTSPSTPSSAEGPRGTTPKPMLPPFTKAMFEADQPGKPSLQ